MGSMSRPTGWLLPIVLAIALPVQAAGAPKRARTEPPMLEWIYDVQRGDTLSMLGVRFLTKPSQWRAVQRLNAVRDPDYLPTGSKLRIPVAWLRSIASGATVLGIVGEVFLERATGAQRRPAAPGDALGPGDRLLCAAGGTASVRLDDGSVVRMAPESDLEFGRLERFTTTGMFRTRLRVLRGRLESLVAPATGAGSRFEVETPVAVTAVRGTNYRVTAEDRAARTEVVEGRVDVGNDLGDVRLAAGFGTVTEQGAAPRPPVPLLPPPDLAGLPPRVDRIGGVLPFAPVPRASAYRIQFARDASFISVIGDTLSAQPEVVVPDVPDGPYFVRVRGIDADRLEGLSTDRAVRVDARPLAASLLRPAFRERTRDSSPTFAWQASEGAVRYRLQVARDAGFDRLVADVDAGPALETTLPSPLPPGKYHWRVIAADAEGEGPPSAPSRFRRLSRPPSIPPSEHHADDGLIDWPPGEAARYRAQLARDEAFGTLVWTTEVAAPPVAIPSLPPGRYFARVQPVEDDEEGEEGEWSAPATIELRERPLPPPALQLPESGAVIEPATAVLSWSPVERAAGYRVQVAADESFAAPLTDARVTDGTAFTIARALPSGRIFWRVATLGRTTQGDFSPARDLREKPVAPRVTATLADPASLTVLWSTARAGQSFAMQVARDETFATVLADVRAADNSVTVPVTDPGRYFIRVAAVDADGYLGGFGEPHPVDVPAKEVPKTPPRWPIVVIPLLMLLLP